MTKRTSWRCQGLFKMRRLAEARKLFSTGRSSLSGWVPPTWKGFWVYVGQVGCVPDVKKREGPFHMANHADVKTARVWGTPATALKNKRCFLVVQTAVQNYLKNTLLGQICGVQNHLKTNAKHFKKKNCPTCWSIWCVQNKRKAIKNNLLPKLFFVRRAQYRLFFFFQLIRRARYRLPFADFRRVHRRPRRNGYFSQCRVLCPYVQAQPGCLLKLGDAPWLSSAQDSQRWRETCGRPSQTPYFASSTRIICQMEMEEGRRGGCTQRFRGMCSQTSIVVGGCALAKVSLVVGAHAWRRKDTFFREPNDN